MAVHPQVGVWDPITSTVVSKRWLADVCAFGEVTWATSWVGGLDTFSWAIPLGQFPALRRGVAVTLWDGGLNFGKGYITEVTPGEVHGEGLWNLATRTPALDSSGNPTTVPNTGIDQALARGDLPGWSARIAYNRPTAIATTAPGDALMISEVIERDAQQSSLVPWVDQRGEVMLRALPTTPAWQTTPADGQLTTASDEYATHLNGYFFVSAGVGDSRIYPSTATTPASDRWGKVTKSVDLTPLGVITTATVDNILAGMLARGMARPTWAGTLDVTSGELTTLGGAPSYLPSVIAGDGIRLRGTFDDTRLLGGYTSVDITAGRVEYVDGAATAKITPVGYAPRDLKSILTVALEGAA